MRTLPDEIDELLSRAIYMEGKVPGTATSPDYWVRLVDVCNAARKLCPQLKNVVPDESKQTWAEIKLCLEAVNEALHVSKNA